jgi:hypothetical protein
MYIHTHAAIGEDIKEEEDGATSTHTHTHTPTTPKHTHTSHTHTHTTPIHTTPIHTPSHSKFSASSTTTYAHYTALSNDKETNIR